MRGSPLGLRLRPLLARYDRCKSSKGSKKKKSKGSMVANKHKTWGECPVDLMADFLTAVSAGKLNEAMKMSNKILEHEPDNPLIKMYQESLGELMTVQKAEEKHGGDSDEDDQEDTDNFITFSKINGEQQSEDDASDESDSEEEGEKEGDGMAEDKHGQPGRADYKDGGSKGAK